MSVRTSTNIGGSSISLETGSIARLADGAVVVQQGDTVVLVAAVCARTPRESVSFVPLTCDYREKTYAAGKIPGGFFKREGRPTEKETLTARLIDRPIRPLIPKGFMHEVQVMASVLSSDGEYDPDILAVIGASCALRLSPLTFEHTLGAVRVGSVNGELVVNPTYAQLTESPVDLVIAGTKQGITMIEAGIKELSEEKLLDAIRFGAEQLKTILGLQEELIERAGKPNGSFQIQKLPAELLERVREIALPELAKVNEPKTKGERDRALAKLSASLVEQLAGDDKAVASEVMAAFEQIERDEVRRAILKNKKRMDGRSFTDLREISCEVGILPRTHGSALFTRGETQSLAATTLGTRDDEQMIEALEGKSYKRFMLHYNFPPFSVGEVRPIRGAGRREIGHGALAERALQLLMPSKDEFPYTIRVVSDILESNGSSSMATVCASSLSLMDAGVPVKSAVSGVAMGLVKDAGNVAILTDISGLEDHAGDMDFKVAGTRKGVTALQLDVKIQDGLSVDLIKEILEQSKPARLSVLDKMDGAINQPRAQISLYAPRITTIKINREKIRDVIGPGGRMIRKIIEETGATINVEDDGSVSVASSDAAQSERAVDIIRKLTEEAEVGKIYNGKVKRIMNFGAFCEILPNKEGLVHVSELADSYVSKVEDVVKLGDEFPVKVIEIDEQGRVNLSRKRAMDPSKRETVDSESDSPKDRGGQRPSRRGSGR